MNNLLAVSSELADKYPKYISIPEAMFYALLGFAIVFLGIAFLILIVSAVGKLMQKNKLGVSKTQEKPVAQPVQPVATPVLPTNNDELDEETVAVITAAIMAYYEQNTPKCEFTLKRIKRF